MSNKEAWEVALERLFPNGLMLMDGDKHTYHRNIMNEAFKKGPMQGYLDVMPPLINNSIHDLDKNNEVLFFPLIKELTLTLATTVFFGIKAGEEIKGSTKQFQTSLRQRLPYLLIFPGLDSAKD